MYRLGNDRACQSIRRILYDERPDAGLTHTPVNEIYCSLVNAFFDLTHQKLFALSNTAKLEMMLQA